MKPLYSVITDAHVSPTDTAWVNSGIRGDARYALQQFVSLSIENKVVAAVGLGDLIDRAVNRALAPTAWMRALDQLESAGIPFLFIQGNHDMDDPPWLSMHRNAVHMHGLTRKVGPLVFYGLDYQPADRLTEALANVPTGVDVLLCHQGWEQFMNRPGSFQGSLKNVTNARLVLTGDLHARKTLKLKTATGNKIEVHSPGATCKQAVNEPDEHFILFGDRLGSITECRLNSRIVLRCDTLTTAEQLDTYLDAIPHKLHQAEVQARELGLPEELIKPLVVIYHAATLTDVRRRAERVLAGRGFLFCVPVGAEVNGAVECEVEDDNGRITLLNCLAEEVPGTSADDVAVRNLIQTLINAGDVNDAEESFRTAFLKEDASCT